MASPPCQNHSWLPHRAKTTPGFPTVPKPSLASPPCQNHSWLPHRAKTTPGFPAAPKPLLASPLCQNHSWHPLVPKPIPTSQGVQNYYWLPDRAKILAAMLPPVTWVRSPDGTTAKGRALLYIAPTAGVRMRGVCLQQRRLHFRLQKASFHTFETRKLS
jgi:hypothetical protein